MPRLRRGKLSLRVESLQEKSRIHTRVVQTHIPMQMRASNTASSSATRNNLTSFDSLARLYVKGG